MPCPHPQATAVSGAARWRVCTVLGAVLLASCGGGGEPASTSSEPEQALSLPPSDIEGRRFNLWTPAELAARQAEQLALDPLEGANQVRLIVRMNPAAVPHVERRALLGAGGTPGPNGERGEAATQHAQRLAAKASAVAVAAQSVLGRSVLQHAPQARVRQQFSHALEAFVISVPWDQAQAVADALAADPAVDSVEPDRLLSLQQDAPTPRVLDPRAWGVDRIDQRQRSFDQRFVSAQTGAGVRVYVVDTGISPHAQFGNRLRPGFSGIADGRGTRDCHGHGTHVAGTAAGSTLGVAPAAELVPVRVMDCQGKSSGSSLLAGLDWIAAQGQRPAVVNMSLGGPASSTLDAATRQLLTAGYSVVASAGNSRLDACTISPARTAGVLTVAATDSADTLASFSNWGACVALSAPGVQIASAGVASAEAVVAMSGTSMAAPHAAGAAALVLQAQPAATPAQVLEHLRQQATPNVVGGAPAGTPQALLYAGSSGSGGGAASLPALPSVRSASLDISSRVPTPGRWTAHTLVHVVDQAGQPVSGARVHGRYSHMGSDLACTTGRDGSCTLNGAAAVWGTVTSIGFALQQVTAKGMAYDASGPLRAQIEQPQAPVASIASISGTMLRASSSSANWRPRFGVTVRAIGGAGIASADVQGLLTVYRGGQVAAQRTVNCKTSSSGLCNLDWPANAMLDPTHTGATLQVQGVSRTFLVYQAGPLNGATLGQVQ